MLDLAFCNVFNLGVASRIGYNDHYRSIVASRFNSLEINRPQLVTALNGLALLNCTGEVFAFQINRVQTNVDQNFGPIIRRNAICMLSSISNGNLTINW